MLLKDIIKSKGVKQKWIAQRLGVSEVAVSNWVKGKSVPSEKHLLRLSELLYIPFKDLQSVI